MTDLMIPKTGSGVHLRSAYIARPSGELRRWRMRVSALAPSGAYSTPS
jgi:hypothetical protein